jgi:hypothetical protein
MAKTKISEFSSTAASNTDIDNINIAEGCSPSNINNAIRALMSQLKNQQDGSSGDNFSVGGNLTVTGTTTLASTTLSTPLPVASGGTGASTNAGTAYALKGANSDIKSITGLTTPLTTAQGGTGTASTTFANLTTNVTGTLPVANGGTGATTLTSGSVIIGAGTSTPTFVAPTTTGNVLFTTDGTTWSSTAKIVRATAQTTTSGTNIDFTSIPAWVKRITVMLSGVSTSGTSSLQVQLGTGATPTYTVSGYNGGVVNATGTSITNNTSGLLMCNMMSSARTFYGQISISLLSGNTWSSFGNILASNAGASSYHSGGIALGAALTAIRINAANGTDTFTAGTINIMYE